MCYVKGENVNKLCNGDKNLSKHEAKQMTEDKLIITNYKPAVLFIFSKEKTAPDLASFDDHECDKRM